MKSIKVCSLNSVEVRGIREFQVNGITVAVVRGDRHTLVIPPMCPHLEEPLCEGVCDGATLTCHKHLWQWDAETGAPIGLAEKPLKVYPSQVVDGQVFAQIEEEIVYDYE